MRASSRIVAIVVLAADCQPREVEPRPSGSASSDELASSSASVSPDAGKLGSRVMELRGAELSRRAAEFRDADGTDHELAVRRAGARGLARLRSPAERPRLLAALSDDDPEVVAWAAYGLGDICASARDATVSSLVARGVGLHERNDADRALRPLSAIARAIGRCASDTSEKTLLDWAAAGGRNADDAVFALGDIAQQRGSLREETCVALLELAAGSASSKPWALALQPLGRVKHLPPSVAERARQVAVARLADGGVDRIHAVRTLGRTDETAAPALLGELVAVGRATPSERAEAARALGRLGASGQRALRDALTSLLPDTHDPIKATALVGPEFGGLVAALDAITDLDGARAILDRYAKLEVAVEAPPSVVRRTSMLRCAASRVIAERDFDYPLLAHCDRTVPKQAAGSGFYGARAMVMAIGLPGTQLVSKRLRAWQRYAEGSDVLARAAAIRLIGEHPELDDPEVPLALALESKSAGVVAAAAEVIAKHPDRIGGRVEPERHRGKTPKRATRRSGGPQVGKALIGLLEAFEPSGDIEAIMHVSDAAGALALDGAREPLGRLCRSAHPLVRQHAERALAAILGGDQKSVCTAPDTGLPLPDELSRLVGAPVKLVFESDVGELILELDPALAPVAVTRIVELAKGGFYDGMLVHRVVPGFVTQLGSPTSDGFGGAPGRASLACETAPVVFRAGSVGMALAGRDTGSSQFFVTHADHPHLDGQYAWLGRSSGPWATLVEGDRILRAHMVP